MYIATVIHIRKIGADKAIIRLSRPQGFTFRAGQYVEVTFNGLPPRFYSLASQPDSNYMEIHVKDNGQGGAGHYACHTLHTGDTVGLTGPFGETVQAPDRSKPALLIAGGMGIVPLKALAEDILARNPVHSVCLYWGVKRPEDLYLEDDLQNLAQSHAPLRYKSIVGAFVGDVVCARESNLSQADIFLSGPPEMINHIVPLLLTHGADRSAIYGDHKSLLETLLAEPGDVTRKHSR